MNQEDLMRALSILPTRVIDTLIQKAGISTFHPNGDQGVKLHHFANDVIAEYIARLPQRVLKPPMPTVTIYCDTHHVTSCDVSGDPESIVLNIRVHPR